MPASGQWSGAFSLQHGPRSQPRTSATSCCLSQETEEEYLGVEVSDCKIAWLQYVGYQAPSRLLRVSFNPPLPMFLFPQASRGSGLRMYDIEEMGPNMQMDRLARGLGRGLQAFGVTCLCMFFP